MCINSIFIDPTAPFTITHNSEHAFVQKLPDFDKRLNRKITPITLVDEDNLRAYELGKLIIEGFTNDKS